MSNTTNQLGLRLTVREKEVLLLLMSEHDGKEIGYRLGISTKTVSVHKSSLKRKLGVSNNVGLVRAAIKHGL